MIKYSQLKSDMQKDAPCFQFRQINQEVINRQSDVYRYFSQDRGIHKRIIGQYRYFSLDGSLLVNKKFFNDSAPKYFHRSRRTTLFRDVIHLRGTRYTISSNPTFELRQKLKTFREDFDEGLKDIPNMTQVYQIGTADYVKNAVLTLYNSFLYEEKTGKYKFSELSYQKLRQEGAILAQAATDFYYGVLADHYSYSQNGYNKIKEHIKTYQKLEENILASYEDGQFSSRHITRPEAAHPLIISSAAASYTELSQYTPDLIIGLPSGSTELAYAHALAQKILKNRDIPTLLFPVSLHSIKRDFDDHAIKQNDLDRFAQKMQAEISNKNILIVDDNSSTGQTLDHVLNALSKHSPKQIEVAIAEADTVRSNLALYDKKRPFIATPYTYQAAINILPISKKIAPKNDLRELLERKKMVSCITSRYTNNKNSLSKILIGEAYIDMIKNRTEETLPTIPPDELYGGFRHTFMSNFAKVAIKYDNKDFQSVEHAYQAMKFAEGMLDTVTTKDLAKINRKLKQRGATTITKEMLPDLFIIPELTAGTSKVAANQLRILNYVRKDWDHVKINIMADLLIQKFADKVFYEKLQDTAPKYLIENNDWGDTYWGEVEGRGRNVLGRLLMGIRNRTLEELQIASILITNKNPE